MSPHTSKHTSTRHELIATISELFAERSLDQLKDDYNFILHKARALKLYGFGGQCGAAALAINAVLFNNTGTFMVGVNEFFWRHGVFLGHVAVRYRGVLFDADGPKEPEDITSWGMLDPEDRDYHELARKHHLRFTEQRAYAAGLHVVSKSYIRRHFDHANHAKYEQILLDVLNEDFFEPLDDAQPPTKQKKKGAAPAVSAALLPVLE